MKPAVVLNQKDVKRLLRIAVSLLQLAEDISGDTVSTKVKPVRGPRKVKETVPAVVPTVGAGGS